MQLTGLRDRRSVKILGQVDTHLFAAVLVGGLLLLAQQGWLIAQSAMGGAENAQACSAELHPGLQRCMAEIAAKGKLEVLVDVDAGQVRDFSVEQLAGSVHVVVSGPASAGAAPSYSFANPAGLHSMVRILVDTAVGGTNCKVTIENSGAKPATVELVPGPAHAADATSALEQQAQRSLADAEARRMKKDPARDQTLAAYDKAIEIWQGLGDQANTGAALTEKAYYLFVNQNDAAAAQVLIEKASGMVSAMAPVEAAHMWRVAGYIDAQLSHYDAAVKAYGAALSGYEATGDLQNQEILLENLSRVERLEANTDAALADAAKAATLAEKTGDKRGELAIEEQMGSIYTTAGQLEPAYNAYERALALLKSTSDEHMEGYVWSDLGVVYTELGDYGRAHDALENAAGVWKRSPYPFGEMNTLDDEGDLQLAEGKLEAARRNYAAGLAMADKNAAARYRIFFLRGIGDSYLFQKDAANAEKNYHQALDLAVEAKEGDSTAYIECALGEAALQRTDRPAARDFYGRCLKDAEQAQDRTSRIRAQGGLARTALLDDDLDSAAEHGELALAGIEGQRGSLSSADLRTSYFASMHAYYDLQIQIMARLDAAHPGQGYRWKAFLIAERGRARTLLDQVSGGDKDSFAGVASPLRAQYDEVVRKLRLLESKAGGARRPGDSQAIAQLTAEEHSLHSEIGAEGGAVQKANGPGSSGTGDEGNAAPLTLEMIQAALPAERGELLEYWTGEQASYVWGISKTGVRMLRLPGASELDKRITALREAILSEVKLPADVSAERRAQLLPAARRRAEGLAGSLSRELFPAGLMEPGVTTVAVVADGPVLAAPLAVLGGSDRRTLYLNEPSAAIFCWLESHPAPARPMQVAVFANDAGRGGTGLMPALTYAGKEAEMIRSILGPAATHVFTGASAEPGALRTMSWDSYSVGHFATHAVLNGRYAELNGLVTGGGAGQMLWYGDVCRLHARLDLVVLSACDTALGQNIPGEGLEGLTQAFFAAGSQRVLGTLWPVDDEATGAWMRDFYAALKTTRSPTKALAAAQRQMAASEEWSSPCYWAGFTLAGDWRPLP